MEEANIINIWKTLAKESYKMNIALEIRDCDSSALL